MHLQGRALSLNGEYVCKEGFSIKNNECIALDIACYKKCKDCSDSQMNSCTRCPDELALLTEGICGVCKLGYTRTDNSCEANQEIIFYLNLNKTIKGDIIGSASNYWYKL